MKGKQLTVLLATLAFLLPATAIAREIDVQTGNVRVSTYRDGSISVNTGQSRVEVPPPNRSTWRWNRLRLRTPWSVSCRNSSNSTYQKTTQTTRSGQRVVHHSVSTHSCR